VRGLQGSEHQVSHLLGTPNGRFLVFRNLLSGF
jgi:hypothetical protein